MSEALQVGDLFEFIHYNTDGGPDYGKEGEKGRVTMIFPRHPQEASYRYKFDFVERLDGVKCGLDIYVDHYNIKKIFPHMEYKADQQADKDEDLL